MLTENEKKSLLLINHILLSNNRNVLKFSVGVPFTERKKSVRACIFSLFLVTTYTKKRLHTVDFKEAKTSYRAGHKLLTIRIRKIRFSLPLFDFCHTASVFGK